MLPCPTGKKDAVEAPVIPARPLLDLTRWVIPANSSVKMLVQYQSDEVGQHMHSRAHARTHAVRHARTHTHSQQATAMSHDAQNLILSLNDFAAP